MIFWGWGVAVRTRSNSTRNRAEPRKKIYFVSPIYLAILLWSYFLCLLYVLLFYLFILQINYTYFFSVGQHGENDTGSESETLVGSFVGHCLLV